MVTAVRITSGQLDKCPYQDFCACPGYSPEEGNWIPIDGFKSTDEGVLCIDWGITVTITTLPSGGRQIKGLDSAEKIDETRRKWNRSPARKAAQKKYQDSAKGKKVIEEYNNSERGKLSRQKWLASDKGKGTVKKEHEEKKLFREGAKWVAAHPGRTFQDFLAIRSNGNG